MPNKAKSLELQNPLHSICAWLFVALTGKQLIESVLIAHKSYPIEQTRDSDR